jgi:hypothetical protein
MFASKFRLPHYNNFDVHDLAGTELTRIRNVLQLSNTPAYCNEAQGFITPSSELTLDKKREKK